MRPISLLMLTPTLALMPTFAGCKQQVPVTAQPSVRPGAAVVATPQAKSTEPKVIAAVASIDPDLQGVWKIKRVHVLAENSGAWAEDDDQIVGAQFEWKTPDNLSGALSWQRPDDASFDQHDACAVPELVPAKPTKGSGASDLFNESVKAWNLNIGGGEFYGIRCKDSGRWGLKLVPSNEDDLYGLIRMIGPDKIFMATFSDIAFLAERVSSDPK
jgi:hypothetical protein